MRDGAQQGSPVYSGTKPGAAPTLQPAASQRAAAPPSKSQPRPAADSENAGQELSVGRLPASPHAAAAAQLGVQLGGFERNVWKPCATPAFTDSPDDSQAMGETDRRRYRPEESGSQAGAGETQLEGDAARESGADSWPRDSQPDAAHAGYDSGGFYAFGESFAQVARGAAVGRRVVPETQAEEEARPGICVPESQVS